MVEWSNLVARGKSYRQPPALNTKSIKTNNKSQTSETALWFPTHFLFSIVATHLGPLWIAVAVDQLDVASVKPHRVALWSLIPWFWHNALSHPKVPALSVLYRTRYSESQATKRDSL